MTLSFEYPTPLPSTKGWGPGWPNCQQEAMVPLEIVDRNGVHVVLRAHTLRGTADFAEVPFVGGIHKNIAELALLILGEADRRGFDFMEPGCWAYGCRATKGGSGDVPSFHSWGLALDINAPRNVFGADQTTSEIATSKRWLPSLMQDYGFFWLGPAIKDWMHFSFVGSPADARDMTAKARREIGDDMGYADFEHGLRDSRQDQPKDPQGNPDYDLGYALGESVKRAATLPVPGTPAAHEHNLEGKAK